MPLSRLLFIFSGVLFATILIAALFKGGGSKDDKLAAGGNIAIPLGQEVRVVTDQPAQPVIVETPQRPREVAVAPRAPAVDARPLPEADRIGEFFNRGTPQFPIVKTITYKSRVDWLKGRPAWLSDYAGHFKTSRHLIARSLNGKADYLKQDVNEGNRFNILNPDKNFEFHLVVDVHRCKMLFYYVDKDDNTHTLVKTYDVGLGRVDPSAASGFLTPLGKFSLGDRIATYAPKMKGFHNGEKVELITVFGTRWIPFECEIEDCTGPAQGLGIHGVPWDRNSNDKLAENTSGIGQHKSDGCIRMATSDVEELFAIIISRPTTVELVRNFYEAKLPGKEVSHRSM